MTMEPGDSSSFPLSWLSPASSVSSDDAAALPPTLYYYTDAAGLKGILNPGSWPWPTAPPEDEKHRYPNPDDYVYGRAAHLMASDVRYMNDSAELSYAAEFVRERFTAARDDDSLDPQLRIAFGRSAATFEPESMYKWPWRSFAACFCEDGDLLSQWRGYAGGTGGFAIGFSTEALKDHSVQIQLADHGMVWDMPSPAHLSRVAYGPVDAANRVETLMSQIGSQWRAGQLIADLDGSPGYFVGLQTFRAMASIKHEAFEAEREWRLLVSPETRYKVKTRPRSGGLVPYVDLIVNGRLQPGDPQPPRADVTVHEIVVGPAPDQEAQIAAVQDLLAVRRPWWEQETTVRPSTIPFRS